jgi:glucose/arabinose dehydrogenase
MKSPLALAALVVLAAACAVGPTPPLRPLPTTAPAATVGPTLPPAAPTVQAVSPTPIVLPTATPSAPAPIPPAPSLPSPTAPLPSPTAFAVPSATAVRLEPFVVAPAAITYLTHAGDGSGRLFLVEKAGRIHLIADGRIRPTPFLDIRNRVEADASEQGLLSVAFPPDYAATGAFYVNYTAKGGGDTVVARYRRSADPDRADPASEQVLLRIPQPAANHNGGQLQFGPDGYLYIGMGDGGAAGDPWDNAENLQVLLGKLLRIDVRPQAGTALPYAVPPDNPFLGEGADEIWAYGLRNPWRFSFDRLTGDLYIADVGQNRWEEVHVVPAGSPGGRHFGWDTLEGSHCFEPPQGCDPVGKEMPVFEYDHGQGCSITGGYVYRGRRYPALHGMYLFGDFCSGRLWGLWRQAEGRWQTRLLLVTDLNIASFGEDEAGELYVLDLDGGVYRVAGE